MAACWLTVGRALLPEQRRARVPVLLCGACGCSLVKPAVLRHIHISGTPVIVGAATAPQGRRRAAATAAVGSRHVDGGRRFRRRVTASSWRFPAMGSAIPNCAATAEFLRRELLLVPGVKKVELFGEQQEQVFLEISRHRLARLGINEDQIYRAAAGEEHRRRWWSRPRRRRASGDRSRKAAFAPKTCSTS